MWWLEIRYPPKKPSNLCKLQADREVMSEGCAVMVPKRKLERLSRCWQVCQQHRSQVEQESPMAEAVVAPLVSSALILRQYLFLPELHSVS